MEKVYDPATGHEVRELTGKYAGQKYLVDSSGGYAGLYGSGGSNVTPISYDTTGITTASGLGTDTGITPTSAPVSNEVAPVYSAPDYSGAINTGFADLNTSLGTNFGAAQTDRAAMNTLASNREALATVGRNQLGTNLNTGFKGMGGRFDTVDTNVGNVQSAVDQGFVDQSAGFADAQTDRNTQSLAAQTDRNAQFAATGAAMNTGFDNTAAGQTNIIKGQTGIGTTLETMGNTADIYAGQSLENQQAMQQGIDTQASTFDDYIDRYSDDTRFAQDSRQDLALAQANFANNMADDQQIYYNNLGRDINTQKLQLDAIRNQQLQDAAAQVEAAYQNSLSQLAGNAQSGQQASSGLGSPFSDTQ